MKRSKGKSWCVGLMIGIIANVVIPAQDASAAPGKLANFNGAPTSKSPLQLAPTGLRWGMNRGEVEDLIDHTLDDEALPRYKKLAPGSLGEANLNAEVNSKKRAFRSSYVDLNGAPTGLDSSPLASEFSKGNGEALMSHIGFTGIRVWFFFIGGRLWKTLEEIQFVPGGLYGKNVSEAATKLIGSTGNTSPRSIPADPDKGNYYVVYDWQDNATHLRIWDRSGTFVIVREEKSTVSNLSRLRRNNLAQANSQLDPQVAAVLKGK